MDSSRPLFNFFADVGEVIVGPSHAAGLVTVCLGILSLLLLVATVHINKEREQLVDAALYSDLNEEVIKVSEPEPVPTRVGRVQSINLSDNAAVVRSRANKNFEFRITDKTRVFVYVPTKPHLLPVTVRPGQLMLSPNDIVAFAYNPSTGEATHVVFLRAPRHR